MKTQINKSEIFTTAWEYLRAGIADNMSEALKSAWKSAKGTSEFKSTYQRVGEINDVKSVFNAVSRGFSEFYSLTERRFTAFHEVAETVLEFVAENSKGFQADIASKALKYGNPTDKQAWCVAFEFIKIKDQYDAWVSKNTLKIA